MVGQKFPLKKKELSNGEGGFAVKGGNCNFLCPYLKVGSK